MKIEATSIPGCRILVPRVFTDDRGRFVKAFEEKSIDQLGVTSSFSEEFYSVSHRGVLRGLHFQLPPMTQEKIITCVAGKVLDAIVDLRIGSPTYGQASTFILDGDSGKSLYVAKGLAHGFYVLSDVAVMAYKVSPGYSAELDGGVRWDSAGIAWPDDSPILSPKDRGLPTMDEFSSPFTFKDDRITADSGDSSTRTP